MLNVLNTQLYRLKKSKLFWALFIVCGVLPILSALFITAAFDLIVNLAGEDSGELLEILQMEGGAMTLSLLSVWTRLNSNAGLFSLICSSIFLSGEFTGGSIRNMVLANKSRTQIFFSFLSTALIIGFSYLGVAFVSSLTSYGLLFGFGGVTANEALSGLFATLFLALISIALVQSCVCMFLFASRKTGPTVAFPLLIIILLPSIITSIVEIVLSIKIFAGEQISPDVLSWVPLTNMDMFSAADVDGALLGKIVLYNVPLAVIFGALGWWAAKKDMK